MKVVQISDCHVSAAADALYRGIDPRRNLERLLPMVRAEQPDLLLLTGDLSEDASDASYAWLADRFGELGVPMMSLPGNHDHAGRQTAWFAATAGPAPLVLQAERWQLILLNSAVPDKIGGCLAEAVLQQLDETLGANSCPTLIGLHHQPLPVGSRWIDRYPLADPEALWTVLEKHQQVRVVVWGHVHHAVRLERNGVLALGAPSTACNSIPGSTRFTRDPRGPAYRWLDLQDDGGLDTGVCYG